MMRSPSGTTLPGVLMVALEVDNAPIAASNLPFKTVPAFKAPLFTSIVPLKTEESLMIAAPLTLQYTCCTCAPLIKLTLERVLVESAPLILITNTAALFPCASR
jgi:hypothetical protein